MQINLIAMGQKMPHWVNEAYADYAKRLPTHFALHLIELPSKKRLKNSPIGPILAEEARLIEKAIPPLQEVIALDRLGKNISTQELANHLQTYQDRNQSMSLIIGGPEGLDATLLKKADKIWSLSALTLPHPLVRVLVAEQIYRAFTILTNHPYHR